jgi:molybdenum cofactor synthesis domain-containing protein
MSVSKNVKHNTNIKQPLRAVVLTVSDRCARGEQEDKSGPALVELLKEIGAEITAAEILSDDLEPLAARLRLYAERTDVDIIITTGGTGVAPRDNTPEATRAVIESEVPGLAEAMRAETWKRVPTAMLSRGVCGIRGDTLIINLPGSPAGVRECFDVIKSVLPHAVALLRGAPHEKAN